jgi:hypothetical protein
MEPMSRLPLLALASIAALGALALVGCGDGGGAAGSGDGVVPVSTLPGVGQLPGTVAPERAPLVVVAPPVNADGTPAELVGVAADGNRVLLIGDSILASTSSRYGGQMCEALVPLGWQVAVEAEPSRFIDFGNRVLDEVLDENAAPEDDWHAAVVFLGSNYGGDEVVYEAELREILDRLAPRPTLLFTVTEYRSNYTEVNEVVRRLGTEYGNVTVLDWQAISQTPGVLSGDRLHPTEKGREVLAQAVAAALGPIGVGEGTCLRSAFRDDSANNAGAGGGSSVGGSASRPTTTAPRPVTTTTVADDDGGSGGGGGGGGATTTAPVTTAPPTTAPATTAPPTTAPPTTAPPAPPAGP